jgi:hypothetical protein
MNKGTAFISWIAGGTGVVLLYSAYKNVSPVSVLQGTLTGNPDRTPIQTGYGSGFTSGGTTGAPGARAGTSPVDTNPVANAGVGTSRAAKLLARQITPTLVPIPTQPTMRLDVTAMASFMAVQTAYGKPIPLTGAWRSEAVQAQGYETDPDRFAPPGKGGHPVGIAVDVNANKVNLNDPKLFDSFTRYGWYRRGRSGIMHYSYGVPA